MKTNHPNIILHDVPAGCTGVFQVCNVGIQRIFKHSLKRSYHQDVVAGTLEQIGRGEEHIVAEKRVAVLRDQSVSWLWDAHQILNNKKTVKKVWNILTHQCLTHTIDRHLRCVARKTGTSPMRV